MQEVSCKMNNKSRIWVAIDDTDNMESIGTGRLARNMATAIENAGLAECAGVSRHQLLVDPRIPYTSHNSSACLALLSDEQMLEPIIKFCANYLKENYHEGADPGLCVAIENEKFDLLRKFGQRAQKEILSVETAYSIADKEKVHLSAHGGTGLGIIGALAAVGLRSTMNDGRFLELKGIREIDGVLSVGEIIARTAIKRVCANSGKELDGEQMVDTRGWVRPDLKGGVPTLVVEKVSEGLWQTLQSKKKKDDEK